MCVQWGVFVLFAGCVLAMTVSVALFFPETKVMITLTCMLHGLSLRPQQHLLW